MSEITATVDEKSDAIYIRLSDDPVDHTEDVGGEGTVFLDYDAENNLVGVEILQR